MGRLVRLSVVISGFLGAVSPILTGTIFLELFNIKLKRCCEGTSIFLLALMFLAIGNAEIILLGRC